MLCGVICSVTVTAVPKDTPVQVTPGRSHWLPIVLLFACNKEAVASDPV